MLKDLSDLQSDTPDHIGSLDVPELHHGYLVEIDAIAALRRRP
jgi:hypothetical protein